MGQVLSSVGVGPYMRFVTIPELMASGKVMRRPWFRRGGPRPECPERVFLDHESESTIVEGRLRLGVFGPGAPVKPETFTTEWVRGPNYRGMEDCDIRGFVDGGFRWAWNQPGQVHIRVGRLGWTRRPDSVPELGERELFRCLQRWDSVRLPQPAEVLDAALTLDVEVGAPRELDVCLYEVLRDWNPGHGGVERNNVSVPAAGEVWWNEAQDRSETWGKPGAGQTGAESNDADTPETFLAASRYEPGNSCVTFSSPELASYVERRLRMDAPLLLLVKLSDVDEDTEGSVLTFWSAEHGDDENTATRPRLRVTWRSHSQVAAADVKVSLEQGRSINLPGLFGGPDHLLVTEWKGVRPGWRPQVEVCPESATGGEWVDCGPMCVAAPPGSSLRLLAAHRPVGLGECFRTGIVDTWVTSGPPDEQVVEWWFLSPSGSLTNVESAYEGGFRWDVAFRPDEVGTWRYYWNHSLSGRFVRGPVGRFDVVACELSTVLDHLDTLAAEVSEGRAAAEPSTLSSWLRRLMTLERAAVGLISPEAWRVDGGMGIREHVNRVRAALWGRPIPEPLPRVSHPLMTETEGRPLFDPYPVCGRGGERSAMWRRRLRRLKRKLVRLVR